MIQTIRTVLLGDMQAVYRQEEESGAVELLLLPAGVAPPSRDMRRRQADSLVQAHIAGERQPGGYSGGRSMRAGGTVAALRLLDQQVRELPGGGREAVTRLAHPRGVFTHRLWWQAGQPAVRCRTEFLNQSASPLSLELLTSFSLGGLPPFSPFDARTLRIHRLRSSWSAEGRLDTQTAAQLGLEPSWARHGVRVERFGQAGSMPVNGWFPWLVAEDTETGLFWGAMLCHNASWQMEVWCRDEGLALSGGLADREFGHWRKTVVPGESFAAPEAILTVARDVTVDDLAQRMTALDTEELPGEEELPVVFNEYCATWGDPTQQSVAAMVDAVKGRGIRYFVIDAGWYQEPGIPWDTSMGDYAVSRRRFPDGLEGATRCIREAGMVPGIWFEPEALGHAARAAGCTDHLLKRDGAPIATPTRLFWDMRDPWVRQRLREQVIEPLKRYGFGYVKLDYNDTIGPFCDGAESPGEALRQNMAASRAFLEELKATVPGILVESCASGGHRLEPGTVAATALSSFSDAHECAAIPILAADLHRAIPPRKSLIWAVLRPNDEPRRIVWSLTAALLGRLCLSGDLTALTAEQQKLLDEGLAFYRLAAPVIRRGHTRRCGPPVESLNDPQGWQAVAREGETGCLVVLHQFGGPLPGAVRVPLPAWCREPDATYEVCGAPLAVRGGCLEWTPVCPLSSAALHFVKEGSS